MSTKAKAEAKFRAVVVSKGGEAVTNYVNSHTKVRLRCRHGHEWEVSPSSVVYQGTWCPTCSGRSSEAAETKLRSVVAEKGGEVVTNYVNSQTKVRLRCAEGHEWEVKPTSVVHMGTWCPTCASRGRSHRKVRKGPSDARLRAIVASKGGEVLGTYVHSQTNVRLRCGHGHEWDARPANVVGHGTWCPTCAREAHGAKVSQWRQRRKEASSSPAAPSPAASDISLAALVLAMSRVGIDRIEEGNSRQAASRIAIWQKIAGPVVLDGRKVVIGAEVIERNVGLVLPGIEKLTAEGFERRLGEIVAGA